MPSWLPSRAQVGAAMASCLHETKRHGRPAIVDPTKLKYLAVTVMTAVSTVLAKTVRFLRTCKSRVLCRYPGPRESVHIKLLVSPVSFSHNNVRLLMVYSPYGKFAYRATCRFRD